MVVDILQTWTVSWHTRLLHQRVSHTVVSGKPAKLAMDWSWRLLACTLQWLKNKIHYIKVPDNSHTGINVYIAKEYTEYTEYFPVSLV